MQPHERGVTTEQAAAGVHRVTRVLSRISRRVGWSIRALNAAAPPLDPDHGLVRRLAAHPEVLDVIAEVER